jgi:hypothetical protein
LAGCSPLKFGGGASPEPGSTPSRASRPAGGSGSATQADATQADVTQADATQAGAKLVQAQRTHEYPGPPQHQRASGGATSPITAVEVFATAYINWTAGTVAPTMRALAAMSIGQARSEMALAAGETAQDYELKRGGIANSGTVEAIAPVLGHRYEYAVVTRERTTATDTSAYLGLRPAWHLTLATVSEQQGGGWVLSDWQPEN